jgi:FkbM family methyltransferase
MESGYFSKISYMRNYFTKHFGISKTIKGVLFYNYRIFRRQFLDLSKEHVLDVNGYKFTTIPNDIGISEELLMFRTHEPLSTKLLSSLLKNGMYCLDVGSNIGYYACLESNAVGNTGKVISIEPSPINFKYLKKNIELQNMSNTEVYNFACGNENNKIEFLISDRSNWSRVATDKFVDAPPDAILKTITVPVKTIDSIVVEKSLPRLDFIRMDVEGYEINIVEGMHKTLDKFKPLLHMEVHLFLLGISETKKLLQNIQKHGYEILYYIPREMDVPFLGSKSDIKTISFEKLFDYLENDQLPMNFMLFMKHKISS